MRIFDNFYGFLLNIPIVSFIIDYRNEAIMASIPITETPATTG